MVGISCTAISMGISYVTNLPHLFFLSPNLLLIRRHMGGISIKREIGHLCHDERRPRVGEKQTIGTPAPQGSVDLSRTYPARMCLVIPSEIGPHIVSVPVYQTQGPQPSSAWPMAYMYQQGTFGNEFAVLT